jgi:hypothetical protein
MLIYPAHYPALHAVGEYYRNQAPSSRLPPRGRREVCRFGTGRIGGGQEAALRHGSGQLFVAAISNGVGRMNFFSLISEDFSGKVNHG